MIGFELLSKDNLDEVYEIEKRCFAEPWSRKMFESEIGNNVSVYIVARDEKTNRAVGFGGVWTVLDCADITNIAVDKEYRRGGLATEILRLIIKICAERGVKTLNLEVRTTNDAAVALYKKIGFVQNGIRKKYYHNRDDAMLMSLEIDDNVLKFTDLQKD